MGWEIYWGLAFGFILSSVIRAFVSTATISAQLGQNNAKSLGLATFFGGISSSCSYAAASMSRTLVMKGASWTNSIAFLIASTNLVFEIFIVIFSLLGWAFVAGEIVGGLIFILIASLLLIFFFPKKVKEDADEHLKNNDGKQEHQHGDASSSKNKSCSAKLREAVGHFYMDVIMIGKDILIGVAVAAILSVVVPNEWWASIFLTNNTAIPHFLILIWNSVLGIVVAIISFVCSVGNIVLAAVLWHGGISFGGVFAFILSDLVTIPMLLVYRKYYGNKAMIALFIILTLSILAAALLVDYSFLLMHWIPDAPTSSFNAEKDVFQWNYKTILNIIFIPASIIYFFYGKKQMDIAHQSANHHSN